ncbi:2'-5' RNA ligase family protein [Sinorhizobium numidicum]|uniref:2'-5' RNA ligase family protein n=1 Tax=Sinorhizobium numidicum TaxID=680248 RepID=A0ABY8D0E7_9HYPH|nr:2'-5' RNA ligase family protein [Sinorhizobium numidicum]WEX77685.1 2'-5' RNA ligase family protein [Sinorhizobium numidicum]WEX84345.1 2'-5' RNA ligase family protein [Sinorhizobium numidicum]
MSDQLSLCFGPTPAPAENDLLYFAVLPELSAAQRILDAGLRLKREYSLSGRLYPPERLHISLVSLAVPSHMFRRAISAAGNIGSRVRAPPFELTLDRTSSFRTRNSRALVLRCREGAGMLGEIHGQLADLLHQRRPFEPHMTLLYDYRVVPEVRLEEPITWTVREFTLVHSLYGQSRQRHLNRWPLAV